ncbi:unnamed protein product [Cuscuta campestris]|uniref:Uncharacterized protein n=1 Tax=Cuscuta campestris TaxID=132261 RepID=A0A484KP85_9ASTE|nr:unnamed protein product [Cuscuta campestris]
MPYELWRGTKPNLSYLRIWGCDVYVRRLMMSGKLDSISDRCKFVGYPKESQGGKREIGDEAVRFKICFGQKIPALDRVCIGWRLGGVRAIRIGPLPRAALSSTTSTPRAVASPAAASIAVGLSEGAALTIAAAVLEPAAMEAAAATSAVLGAAAAAARGLPTAAVTTGPFGNESRATCFGHGRADGGQDPSLEESVKLEPLIIVFRGRDDGAIDVALEIESANQEEKKTTPLFVVRLREAEKNRNMEFDI